MEYDYGRFMIWSLTEMTGRPFPPYFLELVMKDGRSFYVHSGNSRDEKSGGLVVNVYDLRAMTTEDEKLLQSKLEKLTSVPLKPSELHARLASGLLRCRLDDILYVVQWEKYRSGILEDQFAEASRKRMGFTSSGNAT